MSMQFIRYGCKTATSCSRRVNLLKINRLLVTEKQMIISQ
jgi:hypothetical protein